MREILFRGKRIDNGEWVEGYLLKYSLICEEKTYILPLNSVCISDIEVKSETVCQYTGLTDKNGRKIFEGDILSGRKYRDFGQGGEYVPDRWNCLILLDRGMFRLFDKKIVIGASEQEIGLTLREVEYSG